MSRKKVDTRWPIYRVFTASTTHLELAQDLIDGVVSLEAAVVVEEDHAVQAQRLLQLEELVEAHGVRGTELLGRHFDNKANSRVRVVFAVV